MLWLLKILKGTSICFLLVLLFAGFSSHLNETTCRGYSNSWSKCWQAVKARKGIAAAAKTGTIWEGTFPLKYDQGKDVGKWRDHRRWEVTRYDKSGNAIATYSAGVGDFFAAYIGTRTNGKRHGQGTYTWSHETRYIGAWKDGKQHGEGTFKWRDGSMYVGEWKDNKRHGKGIYTWFDGDRHVGGWKEDKPWEGPVYDPTGNVVATYSEGVESLVD